jgi:hypothetical protein
MELVGTWQLQENPGQARDQATLLERMNRAWWQRRAIAEAKELFTIEHKFHRHAHIYQIKGHIFLASQVLQMLQAMFRIPFSEVKFVHQLYADGRTQNWPDDAKMFGSCSTTTSFEDEGRIFTVHWKLAKGTLTVRHWVDPDSHNLLARMTWTPVSGAEPYTCLKRYTRVA